MVRCVQRRVRTLDKLYIWINHKISINLVIVITITGLLIWGMWASKIPVLLGINLIVALAIWGFLTYRKVPIKLIIGVIITVTGISTIVSGMSNGNIPTLTGVNSIVLLLLLMCVIAIWDFLSFVWNVIESTDHRLTEFITIYKGYLETQSEINRRNLETQLEIVDRFYEAIDRLMDAQKDIIRIQGEFVEIFGKTTKAAEGITKVIEDIFTELKANLEKNEEELEKNTEELDKIKGELSNTVKVPGVFRKFLK